MLVLGSAAFGMFGGVSATGAVIAKPVVAGASSRDARMSLALAGNCAVGLGWGVTAGGLWLLLSRLAESSSLRSTQFFVSLRGCLIAASVWRSVARVPYPQGLRHLQNSGWWWHVRLPLV